MSGHICDMLPSLHRYFYMNTYAELGHGEVERSTDLTGFASLLSALQSRAGAPLAYQLPVLASDLFSNHD